MGLQHSCSIPAGCKERSFGLEQELQQLLATKTPSARGQGQEGFNCNLWSMLEPETSCPVGLGLCVVLGNAPLSLLLKTPISSPPRPEAVMLAGTLKSLV